MLAVRSLRSAVALLVLAHVAVLAGCQKAEVALPLRLEDGTPPNVLLITVDTLRADHLGAYGYPLPTSPNTDALAARGMRFADAVATAPETAPSMASLFTGLYQHRSRVAFNRHVLGSHLTTLPERFAAAGYATAGFAGNGLVGTKYGFEQGFDHFEDYDGSPFIPTLDDRGVDLALAWLGTRPAAPWLLWLHLKDPHGPYNSADPSWSADFSYPDDAFGADEPLPVTESNFGLGVIPRYQSLDKQKRLSYYVRRYDGEIRWSDAQIGRLLDGVAAAGQAERTLVVLTADHGESLTEHDEHLQHGWFLYETTLRVPLIVALPGVLPTGRDVAAQVSLVDVVPTLVELLGLARWAADEEVLDGTSSAPLLVGREGGAARRPVFAVGPRENHQYAIRQEGWKLILTLAGRPVAPKGAGPPPALTTEDRVELYDLAADPGETRDLAAAEPERRDRLRQALARFRQICQMAGLLW